MIRSYHHYGRYDISYFQINPLWQADLCILLIIWMSPCLILGIISGGFHSYCILHRNSCKHRSVDPHQTPQNVCAFYPKWGTPKGGILLKKLQVYAVVQFQDSYHFVVIVFNQLFILRIFFQQQVCFSWNLQEITLNGKHSWTRQQHFNNKLRKCCGTMITGFNVTKIMFVCYLSRTNKYVFFMIL